MKVRRGFTLIEFLIVVAIVAILAAIILPYVWISAARSRRTACGSNMKSIVKAVGLYSQDYGGKLPPNPAGFAWTTGYIKPEDLKELVCPEYFISAEPESGRGFGFNLKLATLSGEKAYLWDGDDYKTQEPQGVFDQKLGIHIAQWVEHRHFQEMANVGFVDGNVKVFPIGAPDPEVFRP